MIRLSIAILAVSLIFCSPKETGKTSGSETLMNESSYKEVVCFVYHRFGDDRFPTTNVSIEDFKAHLQWLKENKYQVLNLSDATTYLSDKSEIKKTAVITIDDGFKSFYKNALPILRQYDFPATLFINTTTVGGSDYMDWGELEIASRQSIEIGNHSHSHDYFLNKEPDLRYTEFEKDIGIAQKLIVKNLGITPKVFAYPYGEFDQKIKSIVESFGFSAAAAQNSGVMSSQMDKYQIPRFPMSEQYAKMFEEKARMQSLHIIDKQPMENLLVSGNTRPQLKITLNTQGLITNQMQCFVQGAACSMNILKQTSGEMILSVQSTGTLDNRRRTLYTITVPDSTGNWHWFSHLWINNSVK